tara:strand:- start:64856 stop:65470 length:615 start_codon:yes stop_codon:yes gene_type:complete
MKKTIITAVLATFLFASCDKDEKFNRMSVTSIVYPDTDPECPEGGHRISEGGDYNDDGYLNPNEVAYSYLICSNSSIDGESTYDLAVESGYEGTLEEWLESIKGLDGTDGIDGTDGEDGADGSDGQDGTNGIDGLDGADGQDGNNGSNGTDGSNGEDGEDNDDDDDDDNNNKVTLCHNNNTLSVNSNAVQAHLNHGDSLGECKD